MANEITTFTNEEFGSIRTILINGEPWFVGRDIAKALGYSNTKDALLIHVSEDDRMIIHRSAYPTLDIPNRGLTIINEPGFYSLVLNSRLPSAKKFKRWVTHDVLPSIRKTGNYATPQLVGPSEELVRLCQEMRQTIDKFSTGKTAPVACPAWKSKIFDKLKVLKDYCTPLFGDEYTLSSAIHTVLEVMNEDYGVDMNEYMQLCNNEFVFSDRPEILDCIVHFPEVRQMFVAILDGLLSDLGLEVPVGSPKQTVADKIRQAHIERLHETAKATTNSGRASQR